MSTITWNTNVNAPLLPREDRCRGPAHHPHPDRLGLPKHRQHLRLVIEERATLQVVQRVQTVSVDEEKWECEHCGKKNRACDHDATDGTVDCKDCGMTATDFITTAGDWLRDNDRATAMTPVTSATDQSGCIGGTKSCQQQSPGHRILAANAEQVWQWFQERGGIAVWRSIDICTAGQSWTTPLRDAEGQPTRKQDWRMEESPSLVVTDPMEVVVDVPREVKRFRVAVRAGSQGLLLRCSDTASRRIRRECAKAGEESWHEFDYATQEAVIFVQERASRCRNMSEGGWACRWERGRAATKRAASEHTGARACREPLG